MNKFLKNVHHKSEGKFIVIISTVGLINRRSFVHIDCAF